MYIVNTGASWLEHPYLYTKEGLIRSQAEIAEIINQGFSEAYYDPDQSAIQPEEKISLEGVRNSLAAPPSVSLPEELGAAEDAYTECVNHAKSFMLEARTGKVELESSRPLVCSIIDSVNRNADAMTSLAKIKHYDEYTFAHCVNVTIFSVAFAKYLGFSNDQLYLLGMAGLFHDLGKMMVPVEILNAPRRLTDEEFAVIKRHARLGADALAGVKGIEKEIIEGAGQHHERHDGTGYPDGLCGTGISPFGRIISVADCYDALSAKRVYKDPMPPAKALSLMYEMRGVAWAPGLVEHFIKMIGIYPVGTPVALTSGFKGVIAKANPTQPLHPVAVVVKSPNGKGISPPRAIDLAKHLDLKITQPLAPSEAQDIDTLSVLKSMPESIL
ncbi:MAG: HD-GYP domain-containing protein [Desulfovibrio sp.]|nr:HD-GYP domain-containing protein [Desulfovibrio sp.]